jgi:hypothetical protein
MVPEVLKKSPLRRLRIYITVEQHMRNEYRCRGTTKQILLATKGRGVDRQVAPRKCATAQFRPSNSICFFILASSEIPSPIATLDIC